MIVGQVAGLFKLFAKKSVASLNVNKVLSPDTDFLYPVIGGGGKLNAGCGFHFTNEFA